MEKTKINLNKTINQQKEIFNGDMNIIITLKGSGKSYFMEQKIIELLRNGDNFVIIRNNQINIDKSVISPITALLDANNMLITKKIKKDRYEVDNKGICDDKGIYRCLWGYMSSPSALDGCNLKAKIIFYDEFLKVDRKSGNTKAKNEEIEANHKTLVEDFWRLVNTVCRPNKPQIYLFANPHTPTCLNNDMLCNKTLNFDIDWDKLKHKQIVEAEQRVHINDAWGDFVCKIGIIPVDFNTMNSNNNTLMDKMTGGDMFKFAGNEEKIIYPNKPWGYIFMFNYAYKGGLYTIYKNEAGDLYIEDLKAKNERLITYTHDEIYKQSKPGIKVIKNNEQLINLWACLIEAQYNGNKILVEHKSLKLLFEMLYTDIRKYGEVI